jgi:DDE superfamily endonuclease/Transposase DDE domain
MNTTSTSPPLARFRAELYQRVLGLRRDALCELLDAVLVGDGATSLVRHTLAPCFRRGWASAPDALGDGSLDVPALQRLLAQTMPPTVVEGRLLWVLDGSLWPRPAATTSPERTWGRFVTGGTPESGIVGGWEYQWLAAIPEASGSWVLPLAVGRRDLAAGTATTLAIRQVRTAQAARPAQAPRPLLLLDSHYDVVELVHADLGVDLLARLAANRRFYRRPGPYAGKGAPRKHGPVFRLADPTTHGAPDRTQTEVDPIYGHVTIDVWERLHPQPAPTIELTVIRVRLGRLPRRAQPPKPLWLVWHGGALPEDVRTLQRWYQRRFAIEHAFRFLKQDLGWTAIRPRAPRTADRWSWLLAAGLWQLWLARELVTDQRLPWERPPVVSLSPGRVRRGVGGLLLILGTPARPPRPRGKSPGRQVGQCPGAAPRFPVLRRGPPRAA